VGIRPDDEDNVTGVEMFLFRKSYRRGQAGGQVGGAAAGHEARGGRGARASVVQARASIRTHSVRPRCTC